jgi:transglutaminase-like putative cysteine protease
MRYQITHKTTYQYDRPVRLLPHLIRLRPRSDGWQTLETFDLKVNPAPIGISQLLDLDGNATTKVWFENAVATKLVIQTLSIVETRQENPFVYLVEDWVGHLPIDYPHSLQLQLQPYLVTHDSITYQLAQEILFETDGRLFDFLNVLNQRINQNCRYFIRDVGDPQSPAMTWTHKRGNCRDYAMLFVHACRAVNLAARFVSGYQEGDPDTEEFHLHAWAEVYLPGAGWRGYDPTLGLAVADRHISLVASADPKYAAPIIGKVSGGASSELGFEVRIDRLESDYS